MKESFFLLLLIRICILFGSGLLVNGLKCLQCNTYNERKEQCRRGTEEPKECNSTYTACSTYSGFGNYGLIFTMRDCLITPNYTRKCYQYPKLQDGMPPHQTQYSICHLTCNTDGCNRHVLRLKTNSASRTHLPVHLSIICSVLLLLFIHGYLGFPDIPGAQFRP